jgi:hypothetical protein
MALARSGSVARKGAVPRDATPRLLVAQASDSEVHTWVAGIDPRAAVDIGSPWGGCGCSGQTGRVAVSSIQSF